ncbi:MAG: hypothetical protein KF900_04810 [Bacteroidetes bacterium]|nr:hypothetical protein [Bacteroidota bacterium]
MKVAGVKIKKTTTGKIKSVEIDYNKFSEYVDDFLDIIRAKKILAEDKVRIPMEEVFEKERKRRGLK